MARLGWPRREAQARPNSPLFAGLCHLHLPRREAEIFLTGYSISLRAEVIHRLHELEQAHQAPRVPATSPRPSVSPPIWRTRRKLCRQQNEAMKPTAEVGAAVGKRTNYPQY